MIRKIIILTFAIFILINTASAMDSSNWSEATVGYEKFSIPPEYENPYQSDFNMYEFDEDIDEFTIRYVNPNIMDLYGYFIEHNSMKKVNLIHSSLLKRESTHCTANPNGHYDWQAKPIK